MSTCAFEVQVLLSVHNEAESIEGTIREIYAELSQQARVQFRPEAMRKNCRSSR